MKRVVIFYFTLFFMLSCAPRTFISEESKPETQVSEKLSQTPQESWQIKWQNTVDRARREGKVTIYTTTQPQVRDALTQAFMKRFGIILDHVVGRGAEVAEKLITERRVGLFLGDVYIGGSTTMVVTLKPKGVFKKLEAVLFLPEVLDQKLWLNERFPFLDADKTIITSSYSPAGPISINSTLVKEGEFKSYQDFLNPKWKGKFLLFDPLDPGNGLQWFSVYGGHILGFDWMKEFARQEPAVMKDKRSQADALARGKYAISVALGSTAFEPYKDAGAPVITNYQMKEPDYLSGASSHIALINNAPHPEAAGLFINWFLSKEGQEVFSKAYSRQSAREDIGYEGVALMDRREKGVNYFNAESEEFLLSKPTLAEKAGEIFGHLTR